METHKKNTTSLWPVATHAKNTTGWLENYAVPVKDWMVVVVCSCLSRVALHCQGEVLAAAGAAADEAAAEVCQAAAVAVVA